MEERNCGPERLMGAFRRCKVPATFQFNEDRLWYQGVNTLTHPYGRELVLRSPHDEHGLLEGIQPKVEELASADHALKRSTDDPFVIAEPA